MKYRDSKLPDAHKLGLDFQDFVADQLLKQRGIAIHFYETQREQYDIGESVEGYEVKLDNRSTDTGRLGIEVGEKTRKDRAMFTPSGIMRRDNSTFYVQGNWREFWVFKKAALQEYFTSRHPEVISDNPPTIQKFYLPIPVATLLAEDYISV